MTVISATDEHDRPWKKPRHDEEEHEGIKAKLVAAQPTQPTFFPSWGPRPLQPAPQPPSHFFVQSTETFQQRRESIQAIIEQAAAAEVAAAEAAAAAAAAEKEKAEAKGARKRVKSSKKTPEEKEASKEKRLHKLVGAIVVKCMSKYAKTLNRELFKKYAKEVHYCLTINSLLTLWIAHSCNN